MRKPRKNLTEVKEKHREERKYVSRKNPMYLRSMKERQKRDVITQKKKEKNYKKFEKIKEKEKSYLHGIKVEIKQAIAGKSRAEKKKIKIKYARKEVKIRERFQNKIIEIDLKGIKPFKVVKRIYSKDNFFTIPLSSTTEQKISEVLKQKKDNKKSKYFLIILEGKDEVTGEKVILSDSYTKDSIETILNDPKESFFNSMVNTLSSRKSGENFVLKKVSIREVVEI